MYEGDSISEALRISDRHKSIGQKEESESAAVENKRDHESQEESGVRMESRVLLKRASNSCNRTIIELFCLGNPNPEGVCVCVLPRKYTA